jgi:hypothetical protein
VRVPVSSCVESSRFLWSSGSIVGYMMSALPERNEDTYSPSEKTLRS